MVEKPKDNPYITKPDLEFKNIDKITKKKASEEVKDLREAINYHDYLYYVKNEPIISDSVYDTLFERLKILEEEFNLAKENSPTQRVGGEPLDSLETREHVAEMLSLKSSGDEEEVLRFDERVRDEVGEVTYSMEPKFDGFSVEVVYQNGSFDRAVTRGDGTNGEDISENVKTIRTVPLTLKKGPDFLAVRGEIYMPKLGFQKLNQGRVQEGKSPFANPRNAAAGTVRQLDPSIVAERPLNIYFYDVMDCSRELKNQEEAFNLMETLGLRINKHNSVTDDIGSFIEYRAELLEKRDDLEYDIDGVVAKVNDFHARDRLGETARHPRWAFAYKFPAKTGETVVRKIVVQVGRTGKLTPVALLDPVDIKGVTISRATLHNEGEAKKLGVAEGAKVRVERAGDVIPEIEEVIESQKGEFEMPKKCPICGSNVVQEGEYHFCTGGVSCKAQLKRSLQHFCSKEAMDIDGIGDRIANKLIEEGPIDSIADLYELEKEDLIKLEKFGEKSATNLLGEIEKSKQVDLASLIYALGIRHVGKERARVLAENFSLEKLKNAKIEELKRVEDIGPEIATSIHSFFDSEANLEILRRLRKAGVRPSKAERGEEFEGTKLVFTGKLKDYTREEITDLMERHGAHVMSSVSSETDYLVVGENPGRTKIDEAHELGKEILDADEFEKKFLRELK